MKKLALALATLAISTTALATPKTYKFVGADQKVETQLCVIAATDGLDATKQAAAEFGVNFHRFNSDMTCNGMRLKSFVKAMNKVSLPEPEIEVVSKKKVKMVSVNNITESETCIMAAKEGLKKAQRNYKGDATAIVCNGVGIHSFARKYKKADIL